jgi:eukaryotic-like serine/threonine-protein kinase
MEFGMAHSLIAGRFLLKEPIGVGGMGRIWLAHDQILCRPVAVKEVVPPCDLSDEQLDKLGESAFREARAAAQVDHPGVVRIYDIIQTGPWPWIVMQYFPSRSLKNLVAVHGPLDPAYAAGIGLTLVNALAAAHHAGVLHRDVTPHNVLVGRDGRVMLTDFGLALWRGCGGGDAESEIMGTARYVAPERVISGVSTAEGDLWSLGATLYFAVEGRSPYARPTVTESLSALVNSPPDTPQRAGPLAPVLKGLLEREPRMRLTAAEARIALQQVSADGSLAMA